MQNNFVELIYESELYYNLLKVLQDILGKDIFPLADRSEYPVLYDDDFDIANNKIQFSLRIVISSLFQTSEGTIDITSQVDNFYENKKRILKNIEKKLFPCIKEEELVKGGILPQHYVIQTHDFKLHTQIDNYVESKNKNGQEILYGSSLNFSIHFDITLTIDDISGLIPGGEEMEKIKLNQMIKSDVFSADLKESVLSLGDYDVENMSPNELKEIIKKECFE